MSVGIETRRNIFIKANCPIPNPPTGTKVILFPLVSSLRSINDDYCFIRIKSEANIHPLIELDNKKEKKFI